MISFVPESLQADIIESINDLHFLKGNIEEIEFSVFQKLEESADEYDCEISENSMVCLSVGEDDFPLISVREFLDMAKCKAHLKINDAQSYAKSCNEVYFLLDVRDYATLELLSNTFPKKDVPITELEKTVILDGVKYKVGLFHPLPIIVDCYGLTLILMKYSNALCLFCKIRLNQQTPFAEI